MIKDPIYEPKGRAREYGELALNIYTGCNHGCVYCYAPNVLHKKRENFAIVEPRKGIADAVKEQLSKGDIKKQTILLCFGCDPYPADTDTTVTRQIIESIKNSGNHVQILTKGGFRAVDDFDLLDDGDWFGVTMTGDDGWIEENEPKAASIIERSQSLLYAHDAGIKTWVSFEPVYFPGIVYDYIRGCEYIDLYRIGKLNYNTSDIDWREFGLKCEQLCKEHGRNYYIKQDLRLKMEKTPLSSRSVS